MLEVTQEPTTTVDPIQLAERALGVKPLRAVRQGLAESGKSVHRVDLPDARSAVLRISDRPHTFAFTKKNLAVLHALGLPVQSVLAAGRTDSGGSYIILNWLNGRDLVHEIDGMSRPQMTRLAEQIVECQKRVSGLPHAARFGWTPIGRSGNLEKWTHAFGEPASAAAADDGTPLGGLRARLCTLRSRVESYFETVKPAAFLDDLTLKNVLVENGKLSGIIDVDFVCYGDPLLAVGSTMAAIAANASNVGAFYGEELIRCWNPNAHQRLAIWFYAALWGIGSLQMIEDQARIQALTHSIQSWLCAAESNGL